MESEKVIIPFLHNVSYNVWQICYVNDNNYLCARTYKGKHAEQFARQDLKELLEMQSQGGALVNKK